MSGTLAIQNLVKQEYDTAQYSMTFANVLDTAETIATIVSVLSELRGGGTSDLVITNEAISTDGKIVTMDISGGTRSQTYRVEVRVTLSSGYVREGDGLLRISHN